MGEVALRGNVIQGDGVYKSTDGGRTWTHVGLEKTSDYGKSWTKIVGGLPGDDFPRAIREDPVRRGLLFLGTETGVYVSTDNGGVWQSLRLDLPVTPVPAIQIKNDDLVIGTHGRSFYVMATSAYCARHSGRRPMSRSRCLIRRTPCGRYRAASSSTTSSSSRSTR